MSSILSNVILSLLLSSGLVFFFSYCEFFFFFNKAVMSSFLVLGTIVIRIENICSIGIEENISHGGSN